MMLGRYAQPTGAHIPEARSVSLDASRHNSTLTKILDEQLFGARFVTLAPLFLLKSRFKNPYFFGLNLSIIFPISF